MPRPAAEIVVIYWRDIPAQLNGQAGRRRHRILLPERFQRAIHRAKRKARISTAAEDVAQWRRVSAPCAGDVEAEAGAAAARLDRAYPPERLNRIAGAGGFEEEEVSR